ncbi:flippase [Clostridium beijerinckii]|nr:flippase [Clostridium beijerinckii]
MSGIKKNLIYNILYELLIIALPLITSPYISRVLGAETSGVYTYTYSIAFYFLMFSRLGISIYGNRSIAQTRDSKENRSRIFCSIYAFQFIVSLINIIIYITYIKVFYEDYFTITLIQGFYVFSGIFDISWFFFGMEEFKVTVTRNSIVKIILTVCILLFVKKPEDLWKYTLIISLSTLIGQMSVWPFLKGKIYYVKPKFKEITAHIKPNLILFIPVLATSVFTVMDKIMIGTFSSMSQVGYYNYSNNIIDVPKVLIRSLGTVMLPRMTNLVSNGKKKQSLMYIENSLLLVSCLSIAMAFGIAAVANNFAPLFWGNEYEACSPLIFGLSVAVVFSVWGNVLRTQYLIPNSRDKEYSISLVVAAGVNGIINFILIRYLGALGAVIGTIAAEFVLAAYQTFIIRSELDIRSYLKNGIVFIPFGLIMYIIVKYIGLLFGRSWIVLAIQILCGILIYIGLCAIYIFKSKKPIIIEIKKQVKEYILNFIKKTELKNK